MAEDDPSNQKVLMEMLKRLGYKPEAVADGLEVLQALKRQDYDLVLMDVSMPEMDGITAAREIRKFRPENGPRIIAVTAYALKGDREKCLEAGMDDYISKPVQKKELEAILRKYSSAPGRSFLNRSYCVLHLPAKGYKYDYAIIMISRRRYGPDHCAKS